MAGRVKSRLAATEKALQAATDLSAMVLDLMPRCFRDAQPGDLATSKPDFERYRRAVALSVELADALNELAGTLRTRAGLPAEE